MSECGRETEFEHRLTEIEERSKSNTKRIDELAKNQEVLQTLATNMAVMSQKQDSMETDVAAIKTSVQSLVSKPGKLWEKVIELSLAAVVGAIIGFVLHGIGLV